MWGNYLGLKMRDLGQGFYKLFQPSRHLVVFSWDSSSFRPIHTLHHLRENPLPLSGGSFFFFFFFFCGTVLWTWGGLLTFFFSDLSSNFATLATCHSTHASWDLCLCCTGYTSKSTSSC